MLFAAVHESGNGTTETSCDDLSNSAADGKAEVSRIAPEDRV